MILLTKHIGDLNQELKDFRLNTIFDKIIHIDPQDKKSNYISSQNAIFIDDSFAERERVRKNYGIPVFSPEMVEILG